MMDGPCEDTWLLEREEKEGGNFLKSNQIKKKNRWVRGERKERKEKKTKKKGGGRAVFGGEEKDKEKKRKVLPFAISV